MEAPLYTSTGAGVQSLTLPRFQVDTWLCVRVGPGCPIRGQAPPGVSSLPQHFSPALFTMAFILSTMKRRIQGIPCFFVLELSKASF